MDLTIAYFSLCIVVAIYGRNCRIGFWGVLLFSVLVTPFMVFYGLMGLRPAVNQPPEAKPQTQTKSWWKREPVA